MGKKNDSNKIICEYLENIVNHIVNDKDLVKIRHIVDDRGLLVSLQVSKEDMPLIIGRNGVTSNAIKVLVRSAGFKLGFKAAIRIDEPNE